jgi:microcystin degradation protein MlrC
MKYRVMLAGLYHETHTFLEGVTRWSDFEFAAGADMLRRRGDASPTDGFLEVAERHGWEVVPTFHAQVQPSAIVEDAAFETYWSELAPRAAAALAAGVDAIYLVLHGAMATETFRDTEGELLSRLRALPGGGDVPIFGVLDLHGNISPRMCRLANGLVMYRENPHTDARAAAVRGAELLARCLQTKEVPRMMWCRPPVMWAPPGTGTHADPMLALERHALKLEENPGIWACNVAGGYSFADTPDTGVSLNLITTLPEEAARAALLSAAQIAWSLRERGVIRYAPVDEVVRSLDVANTREPIVLVEPSDNIGGGAPGDGTGILRSLLKYQIPRSLVVIADPLSVKALDGAVPGEKRALQVGGRGSRLDAGPVPLEATFVSRTDGKFVLEDKQSHMASMGGVNVDMGPSAVVRVGGTTILLTSRKTAPFDLGQLRSQGLEPRDFAVIGVKAAIAHKRAYDRISQTSHYVETPGPCSSNLQSFPWRQVRRPLFPLDPIERPEFRFS